MPTLLCPRHAPALAIMAMLIAACAVSRAEAQGLPVYTGEHGAFTRVVVALPADGKWSLIPPRDEEPARLRIAGAEQGFDLSQIWRRIDRSRVADLRPGDDRATLLLDLACACEVTATPDGTGHLILDVAPGRGEPSLLPTPALQIPIGNNAAEDIARALPLPPGDAAPTRVDEPATDGATQVAAAAILHDVSAAISSGILSSAEPEAALRRLAALEGSREPPDPGSAATSEAVPAPVRPHCDAYAFLDIRSGASPEPRFSAIAEARGLLLDGAGRVVPDRSRALVEIYLSLGLGQEVIPLLAAAGTPDAADLDQLARLMEDPAAERPGLAARLACGVTEHVWALFDPAVDAAMLDGDAIVASVDAWSQPLQAHLGPAVMRRLRLRGMDDVARRIGLRLDRSDVTRSDKQRLEAARLSPAGATEPLRALRASADEEVAVAALEDLAHATDDPGEAASLADHAGAMAQEYRGSAKEVELFSAQVAALAASGAYGEAHDLLAADPGRAGDALQDLERRILEAALADAHVARSLSFLVARSDDLGPGSALPEARRLAAAARLLDGGLADPALSVLAGITAERHARDRSILEARGALMLRRPEEAEIALIGLAGEDAETLRAEAREMMGDFAYLDLQDGDAVPAPLRQDAAILAGNWSGVAEADDDAWAEAARLMQAEALTQSLDPERLASFEDIASRSADTRAALEALLSRTAMAEE
ncbi:hypothetical protein [Roseivivax isoporae]|uniref:Uncharacterized protein n=1 Tax=Roseivivax isoporae LMG 25204 TaxID=1449351 RepID=X7FC88_9RHOB|nr:hypothetical protein [Roseivivax isoporae]ETX29716.1 hypothetical protein RISW2_22635 [Roseivivax isoporae LMG 25204]